MLMESLYYVANTQCDEHNVK